MICLLRHNLELNRHSTWKKHARREPDYEAPWIPCVPIKVLAGNRWALTWCTWKYINADALSIEVWARLRETNKIMMKHSSAISIRELLSLIDLKGKREKVITIPQRVNCSTRRRVLFSREYNQPATWEH